MMIKFALALALQCMLMQTCRSFPSGAPVDRCDSMMPGHNVEPMTDPAPYELSVRPADHTLSQFYITLFSDTTKFKGFLLEARGRWDGAPIGRWITDTKRTKTIDCDNSQRTAVTHHLDDEMRTSDVEDGGHFRNVTFTWIRPKSQKLNRVKFIATVVKKFSQIYLNVSMAIKISDFKPTLITDLSI